MIPRQLQDALRDSLEKLLAAKRFNTPVLAEPEAGTDGTSAPAYVRAAPKVYKQLLPLRESEGDPDPFPYVIVRLDSGSITSQTDPEKVAVILLVGIFDDRPENQGHESVLEIIEAIRQKYEGEPNLPGTPFNMQDPFEWVLQDEESFPYFFGAVRMTWAAPAPRRKGSDLV